MVLFYSSVPIKHGRMSMDSETDVENCNTAIIDFTT